MRNLWRITQPLLLVLSLAATDAAALPVHLWSHGFGDNASQLAFLVRIDQAGNVIIAGEFDGSIDFGGGPLTATGTDIYIAKFDPNGNHLWSKSFGDTGSDGPNAIDVDATNHILVSGTFETSVNFGGGALTSAGGTDIFVAKLDPNGGHVWSKRFGDTGADNNAFTRFSAAGDVGMCASFSGSVDFGGGPLVSAGGSDVAVVKLDAGGNHVWSHGYGDINDSQFSRDIAFDAPGNVVFLVQYRGTMDFGGGPLASAGDWDIGLARLDASGNHLWSKRFGNASLQLPRALEIDAAGNVFTAGYSFGNLNLGGVLLTNSGQGDIFVAKYDAAGNHLWSHLYGDAAMQQGGWTTLDAAGNLLVIGFLIGSIDFGGGPVTSSGASDMFVAKLDPNGAEVFSTHYGGTDSDLGYDVAVSPAGNVMTIVGSSDGTINFGGDPIGVTAPNRDALVAAFTIGAPVPVLIQSFEAIAGSESVELRWNLASDEEIARMILWRREGASALRPILDQPFDGTRQYLDTGVESGRSYDYQLVFVTASGDEFRSAMATATIPRIGVRLEQNYPNPFNPRTTIAYTLEERARVAIVIYDASGVEVTRLEQGVRTRGRYSVEWDGRDRSGKVLASGVYFSRLEGVERVEPRKMVLLK